MNPHTIKETKITNIRCCAHDYSMKLINFFLFLYYILKQFSITGFMKNNFSMAIINVANLPENLYGCHRRLVLLKLNFAVHIFFFIMIPILFWFWCDMFQVISTKNNFQQLVKKTGWYSCQKRLSIFLPFSKKGSATEIF